MNKKLIIFLALFLILSIFIIIVNPMLYLYAIGILIAIFGLVSIKVGFLYWYKVRMKTSLQILAVSVVMYLIYIVGFLILFEGYEYITSIQVLILSLIPFLVLELGITLLLFNRKMFYLKIIYYHLLSDLILIVILFFLLLRFFDFTDVV